MIRFGTRCIGTPWRLVGSSFEVANDTHNQHDDGRSTDPPIQISLLAVGPCTCSNRQRGDLYLLEPSAGGLVPARTVTSGRFFDGFSRLKDQAPVRANPFAPDAPMPHPYEKDLRQLVQPNSR